jgi:hypothetical protein
MKKMGNRFLLPVRNDMETIAAAKHLLSDE